MIKKQYKILLFSDLHGDFNAIRKLKKKASSENVDFCICAGDLTNFSKDMDRILRELNSFKKTIFIIPGNHEDETELEKAISRSGKEIHLILANNRLIEYEDFIIVGSEVNGFAREDETFELFAKLVQKELKNKKYENKKIILITHAPPYNTKLDQVYGMQAGNKSINNFIKKLNPVLAVCGHIHESAGNKQMIGKTLCVNAGWNGTVVKV